MSSIVAPRWVGGLVGLAITAAFVSGRAPGPTSLSVTVFEVVLIANG